jgi:hypothetical protein
MTDMLTDKISYEDVAKHFAKARFPERGKPVMSWAKIFKVDDTYELRHGNVIVGKFSPDNKFTFTMSTQHARNSSTTLSQALQRAIPFVWQRKGMGRYVIKPTPQFKEFKVKNPDAYVWGYFKDVAGYELFNGLCFDLNTYEPINARPKISDTIDPDKRKVWLSSLRKFKRAVKVRAKLGVIDALIKEVQQERNNIDRRSWEAPDWNTDEWQDILSTSIKNTECSTEFLKAMIKSTAVSYYSNSVFTENVLEECNRICNNYSVSMRQKFGVFDAND